MSKEPKRERGRPPAKNPQSVRVIFRVSADGAAALDKMKERMGILSFSRADVAREITLRALKAEGLL